MTKKMFECLTCNKKFASKDSLHKHQNIHDKTFQCKICHRLCHSKYNLDVHTRTHSGEKPHACSICGRRFTRKYHLKNHEATHSNEKKFKCIVCPDNRSFKTKQALTHHMVFHYETKFSCSKCGKKFHTTGSLNRHVKSNKC